MYYDEETSYKQPLLIFSAIAVLATGMGVMLYMKEKAFDAATFTSCHAIVTKQSVANFSEIEVIINSDGETETDVHTWSEEAGPVYTTITVNGYLNRRDSPVKLGEYGYYVPMEPEPEVDYTGAPDFDQYSVRQNTSFVGKTIDGKTISFRGSRYLDCMLKLKKD